MNDKETPKLCCLLTTPELQMRKMLVLNRLQKKILDRREQQDGFAFRFEGNDHILDELNEFIKTERVCCPFFTFALTVQGDAETWLQLTGPPGVKEFIRDELGFLNV